MRNAPQCFRMKKEKLKVEPATGQIYRIGRDKVQHKLLIVTNQIVVAKSVEPRRGGGNVHRLFRRSAFNDQIEYGWAEHEPDSDLEMIDDAKIDWSKVDLIGESTTDNLHGAGFKNWLDVQKATDSELLEVSGLGQGGLENLRNYT